MRSGPASHWNAQLRRPHEIDHNIHEASTKLETSIHKYIDHALIYAMQRQKNDMDRMTTLLMATSQLRMLLDDNQHELFFRFTSEELDTVMAMHNGEFVPIRRTGQLSEMLIKHLKIDTTQTVWDDMPPLVKKLKELSQLESLILWDSAMVACVFDENNSYSAGAQMSIVPAEMGSPDLLTAWNSICLGTSFEG